MVIKGISSRESEVKYEQPLLSAPYQQLSILKVFLQSGLGGLSEVIDIEKIFSIIKREMLE